MAIRAWNLTQLSQWMNLTSLRALEAAYQGALAIQEIEVTHFNGHAIRVQPGQGKTITDYFLTQLDRELLKIRSNLLRFRLSGFWVDRSTLRQSDRFDPSGLEGSQTDEALILERLALIESIVGKYRDLDAGLPDLPPSMTEPAVETVTPEVVSTDLAVSSIHAEPPHNESTANNGLRKVAVPKPITTKARTVKPGRLSASARLFGGASQIRKEFSPQYEQEVIQELRVRRTQNRAAVRWLAVLLLVPLLVQIVTKNLILGPLLAQYSDRYPTQIELSERIQEDFIEKFAHYKEILEIKALLAKATVEQEKEKYNEKPDEKPVPPSKPDHEVALATAVYGETPVDMMQNMLRFQAGSFQGLLSITNAAPEVETALEEKALEEKALELWREEREEQLNGLKNVIADGAAIATFVALIFFGRPKLMMLQGFSNRAFLSLNDPTKVFLFILFTDMFVGFHSAEGWEVILESVSEHLGLPESKVFINGFIATVPVIIDACIKFWIFSYLTRYSPSTSAIYERMNT